MSTQTNNSPNPPKEDTTVISYHALRRLIGIMGIVLPVLLVIGLWVSGKHPVQGSISAYYHSITRNIFVATICCYSFFLFAYYGHSKEDKIVARLAAIFALGVVFFPMNAWDEAKMKCDPLYYSEAVSTIADIVHYVSAILFLLMLSYFSIFIFTKSHDDEKIPAIKMKKRSKDVSWEKKMRNRYFKVCGSVMIGAIVLLITYFIYHEKLEHPTIFDNCRPIFVLECIALWAFGFSWLVKGLPSDKVDAFLKKLFKKG